MGLDFWEGSFNGGCRRLYLRERILNIFESGLKIITVKRSRKE